MVRTTTRNTRTTAQKKGDALEEAVQLLETFILGTNPAAQNAIVKIEPKKTITVNGVRHEIDIYITIDHGKGYKAIFIFECKNWAKKVGKDEIIVFSEKVKATQAQTGYFIAKSFTRDAEAQAQQDLRLTLLTATDELDALPPFLDNFHFLCNTIIDSHATFALSPDEIIKPETLTDESVVRYRNEDLLLKTLNEQIRQELVNECMVSTPISPSLEGTHSFERIQTLLFQPNELMIEGQEYYRVDMKVTWETRIIRPTIVSKFDIQTRGRVITYDAAPFPPHGSIQVSLVQTI